MFIFARSHIRSPAGAAAAQALPKTKIVLSKMERTMTFPICGLLYGGSSKVNEDGTPFKSVWESIHETAKVINIPARTARSSSAEEATEPENPFDTAKNIAIMDMSAGKRPLHGTKLLVSIAISLSLGESIIRQPVIPAALQPKPMHMDSIKPLVIYAYSLLPC